MIRVVRKWHVTGEGEPLSFFYGIEIFDDESDFCLRPTYPFSESVESLEDFIEVYRKELLDFYTNIGNWSFSFATYLFIDVINRNGAHYYSEMDNFRNYWFDRGVLIY
ncbi:hypothetical protein AB3329_01800 [Streptococcus sp. H31]|uniref:hypothetical protein n=1 Tax=Streptococcus huangxiaojuni TaxID=3237239 RepID=UPI0034A1C467